MDLNRRPYWDDYKQNAEPSNYHKILFKPRVAVQTRELNQIQSMLQDQIRRFGSSIYEQGSVVIPGNSYADLTSRYVRVDSTNSIEDVYSLENKILVGEDTSVKAVVRKSVDSTEEDPLTLYIEYTSGGVDGVSSFSQGETLYVQSNPSQTLILEDTSEYSGFGTLAYVNEGIYYVNGYFVQVETQSVVVDKYSTEPSARILLKIVEGTVTSNEDQTLLDNASGTYNLSAPGADRYTIDLQLSTLPLSASVDDNYIEIMRYENGALRLHKKYQEYSELEKTLARRTYDESGNYISKGLSLSLREHLRDINNKSGVYNAPRGDLDKFVIEMSSGKAYVQGFENQIYGPVRIESDKARTSNHIKSSGFNLKTQYGQYIYIVDPNGYFDLQTRETVNLYNDGSQASGSEIIGTANVMAIDFFAGDVNTTDPVLYKLWITDLEINVGFSLRDIGSLTYQGGTNSCQVAQEMFAPVTGNLFQVGEVVSHTSGREATVAYINSAKGLLYVYKNNASVDTPRIGDEITGGTSTATSVVQNNRVINSSGSNDTLLFELPKSEPSSITNPETGSYDLTYTVQKEVNINTDANGDGTTTLVSSNEVFAPIETGTFVAISTSGALSSTLFSLNFNSKELSIVGGPASSTVRVYANVLKTNLTPKTKQIQTNTQTYTGSSKSSIVLENSDIKEVVSIIDSVDGDVTSNYRLFNGQRDYVYDLGQIVLLNGSTASSGDLEITYEYYQHSQGGDFFCVDSYPGDPLEDGIYYQTESGSLYELPACLDFRPSVGSNGELGDATASKSELPVNKTVFSSSLQYYVPRIDAITVDTAGSLTVINGEPNEDPELPNIPSNDFLLYILYVPAFTKAVSDIQDTQIASQNYMMEDLQRLQRRVENVEDFVTLTSDEQALTSYNVLDAETGLNKFKTGYIVENYNNDPFNLARATYNDYNATFVNNNLHPSLEYTVCNLIVSNDEVQGGYSSSEYCLMLPYTEEVFAEQSLSSRVTNINPFLVISWDGILEVNPPTDEWVETRDLPTVFESKTDVTTVKNYIDCPTPAPTYSPSFQPSPSKSSPVTENTTYGGFYGEVLGREGDSGGVDYWSNITKTKGVEETSKYILKSAEENYRNGKESTLNKNGVDVKNLSSDSVLSSKIVTKTNSDGSVTKTEKGVTFGGKEFTRTL